MWYLKPDEHPEREAPLIDWPIKGQGLLIPFRQGTFTNKIWEEVMLSRIDGQIPSREVRWGLYCIDQSDNVEYPQSGGIVIPPSYEFPTPNRIGVVRGNQKIN